MREKTTLMVLVVLWAALDVAILAIIVLTPGDHRWPLFGLLAQIPVCLAAWVLGLLSRR